MKTHLLSTEAPRHEDMMGEWRYSW